MKELGARLSRVQDASSKSLGLYEERLKTAQENFYERVKKAYKDVTSSGIGLMTPWSSWTDWTQYATDLAQRSVLFWDTIRRRGNNFLEHERAGKPPLLHFEYEILLDGRHFERPVNYALLKIIPPPGVNVDPNRRPYLIIDPRAGHGPGIGGFKADSQVGIALRDGHPVYFLSFYPTPEPGQSLYDVCAAAQEFVRKVRELHPDSPKPAVVGNCQGGWAAMMLAASDPDDVGPLVITGAPMAYWSGAWHEGETENPMRYTGGLLGGSWLSSLAADLGNGLFDGAHLVQNFEYLNPANTFWDKYYNLFANVDSESERFLQFERWWGGFYLLNKREIEWIVQNLFVGNRLWSGDKKGLGGTAFELRDIKSPIVLFASMGDNITPPEQAFNWVADVYGSTEEIKARGQVIVGLLHKSVGHLGIFVSGKVLNKEYREIVSVLKSIEALPAGIYGMEIIERPGAGGEVDYEVEFVEHRLEDIVQHIPSKRMDEKPFQLAAKIANFNQLAYEVFLQPFVQLFSNEYTAEFWRWFHPLRLQRWAFSDLNPWLAWIGPAAEHIRAQRQTVNKEQPLRCVERMVSELISASLDYYRDVRDAASEATFFQTYGNVLAFSSMGEEGEPVLSKLKRERRKSTEIQQALSSITKGGLAEAVSRAVVLLSMRGKRIPFTQYEFLQEMTEDYRELLPDLTPYQWRIVDAGQELICRHAPEKALAALPQLLSSPGDHQRFLQLVEAVMNKANLDPEILGVTAEQRSMHDHIRKIVSDKVQSPVM
jgi:pimeloyl-ACP methyl ester carboxylesterase